MAKKAQFQAPKGMNDILPVDQPYWLAIFDTARELATFYGFNKIDTPIVENTSLFVRAVGEATDIVEKEMYSFKTKGGDELTLRPEMTASVVRAYIEHGMQVWPQPVQLWYMGPMFRHENPQHGRLRQFNQFGIEMFGDESSSADALCIFMGYKLLESLGLKNLVVKINSIGDANCRPNFIKALKDYYKINVKKVCANCKERMKTNILRVLDCKEAKCQELALDAPQIVDYLDDACKKHFKSVIEFLDEAGVMYVMDASLVRGLDYYNRTVFEIYAEESDEVTLKTALLGGGRYDNLVSEMGGPKTSAVGFGMGIERLILVLKELGIRPPQAKAIDPDVFVVQLGDLAKKKSFLLFDELRKAGIMAKASLGRDNIKAQLRVAHKFGVQIALIVGQKEALEGTVILREMVSGAQEVIPLEKITRSLCERLGKPFKVSDDE